MAVHEEYGALRVRTSRAVPEPKRWRWVVLRLLLSSRIIVGSSCRFSNFFNGARGWRRRYGWVSSSSSRMATTSVQCSEALKTFRHTSYSFLIFQSGALPRWIVFLQIASPSVRGRRCAKLSAWWRAAGVSRRPDTFTKRKLCHCYKHSEKGVSSGLS